MIRQFELYLTLDRCLKYLMNIIVQESAEEDINDSETITEDLQSQDNDEDRKEFGRLEIASKTGNRMIYRISGGIPHFGSGPQTHC